MHSSCHPFIGRPLSLMCLTLRLFLWMSCSGFIPSCVFAGVENYKVWGGSWPHPSQHCNTIGSRRYFTSWTLRILLTHTQYSPYCSTKLHTQPVMSLQTSVRLERPRKDAVHDNLTSLRPIYINWLLPCTKNLKLYWMCCLNKTTRSNYMKLILCICN